MTYFLDGGKEMTTLKVRKRRRGRGGREGGREGWKEMTGQDPLNMRTFLVLLC